MSFLFDFFDLFCEYLAALEEGAKLLPNKWDCVFDIFLDVDIKMCNFLLKLR